MFTGAEIRVVCTVYAGWATGLGVDLPNPREASWPIPQC
jgi:hypothetical protein